MSEKYDEYLKEHKRNVIKSFQWLEENLPEIFGSEEEGLLSACRYQIEYEHDKSKFEEDEYEAYDAYFYGNRSHQVVEDFNRAWLNHIHRNEHHWQHWVLINDDPGKGEIILDMPDLYIIEMICDWWSFSWKQGKLDEIFKWYDEHVLYMKLGDKTRVKVEYILEQIRIKLSESDANEKEISI